jgi:hypothetical protein
MVPLRSVLQHALGSKCIIVNMRLLWCMHARNFFSKHGEVASMHCTTVHETEAVANKINPCVLIYDISCNACTCMHLHPLCGTTLRRLLGLNETYADSNNRRPQRLPSVAIRAFHQSQPPRAGRKGRYGGASIFLGPNTSHWAYRSTLAWPYLIAPQSMEVALHFCYLCIGLIPRGFCLQL